MFVLYFEEKEKGTTQRKEKKKFVFKMSVHMLTIQGHVKIVKIL